MLGGSNYGPAVKHVLFSLISIACLDSITASYHLQLITERKRYCKNTTGHHNEGIAETRCPLFLC